ncbi:MAG: F0F1 ATP synthase subunit B [Ktedonobacterales bacterium]
MGINLYNFISQVITFLILLWVLAKFVFPALIKTMDSRERLIKEGVENAEKSRQELQNAQKRVEALLEEARRDAQATLARATQAAEHVRVEIEQDAQRRSREIITQAEQRTQQLVAQARAQLRQEVADLVIAAAEHVVGNSLDATTSRRLVNEFVAQSRDLQC